MMEVLTSKVVVALDLQGVDDRTWLDGCAAHFWDDMDTADMDIVDTDIVDKGTC